MSDTKGDVTHSSTQEVAYGFWCVRYIICNEIVDGRQGTMPKTNRDMFLITHATC